MKHSMDLVVFPSFSSLFSFEKVSERGNTPVFSDEGCARCQQCALFRRTYRPSDAMVSMSRQEKHDNINVKE